MTDTEKLVVLMAAVRSHLVNPCIYPPQMADSQLRSLREVFESVGGVVPPSRRRKRTRLAG